MTEPLIVQWKLRKRVSMQGDEKYKEKKNHNEVQLLILISLKNMFRHAHWEKGIFD